MEYTKWKIPGVYKRIYLVFLGFIKQLNILKLNKKYIWNLKSYVSSLSFES